MDYNLLPGTEIKVSKICLGTMTFGRQNNEKEGHDQNADVATVHICVRHYNHLAVAQSGKVVVLADAGAQGTDQRQ